MNEAHQLDCDDQRDRHQVAHDNHPPATVRERVHKNLDLVLLLIRIHKVEVKGEIVVLFCNFSCPLVCKVAQEEARDELDQERGQDQLIEHVLHL